MIDTHVVAIKRRRTSVALLMLATVLAGCAAPNIEDSNVSPTDQATSPEPSPMPTSRLTWEEGKAQAQAMELEIASLIPAEVVVSVAQRAAGTLFSCNEAEWRWKGSTTVTLLDDVEIEPIVKSIQANYKDSRFDISTRVDGSDNFEIALSAPTTAENYLVGEWFEPNQIRIDSGSECFTLPEGTWPRGEF